ncbi:hypothetical protein [Microbacterium schleiferi]|nr:hypothetical protein [Microbacterium schleiferi]
MNTRWKSFIAVAVVPVLAFGVAGCAQPEEPSSAASEPADVTAAPQQKPTLDDFGDYLSYSEEVDGDSYYGFLAKDGLVETADGSYYRWFVPTQENSSGVYDSWGTDLGVFTDNGWTDQQIVAAKQLAFQMATLAFDSDAADRTFSDSERAEWVNTVAASLPMSDEIKGLLSQPDNQVVIEGYADGLGQLPQLLHDGGPRSVTRNFGNYLTPTDFKLVQNDAGTVFGNASFRMDVSYRVSDEAMAAYLEAIGSSNIPEDILGDGTGTNLLHVRGTYEVGVQNQPDGSVRIVGLEDKYEISTDY